MSRYDGSWIKGFKVQFNPINMPMARGATCPFMLSPCWFALSILLSKAFQPCGLMPCAKEMVIEVLAAFVIAINVSNSSSISLKSEIISSTPAPALFRASPMPTNSSLAAVNDGVGSPVELLWFSVRELLKPNAPARIASSVSCFIARISSAVAGSLFAPRSPMT